MPNLKYVYFISCQGYGYDGFFKLGVTSNYKRRFSEISKNIPFFTILTCVVEHSRPLELEYNTFEQFKRNRFKGEWLYSIPSKSLINNKLTYFDFTDLFIDSHKTLQEKVKNYLINNCDGKVIIND